MTVNTDKVKPFLGNVPKSWLADEPSSDVRELPERVDEEITPTSTDRAQRWLESCGLPG